MTLDEYAVEKMKELESLKVEHRALEKKYNKALDVISKLHEENDEFIRIFNDYSLERTDYESLKRGGMVSFYLSDPYERIYEDLSKEDQIKRADFDFIASRIKNYRDTHPEPKKTEEKESKDLSDEDIL